MNAEVRDILTVDEAADYLRLTRTQMFELTRNRSRSRSEHPLPVIKVGKFLRFKKSSLDQWLDALENGGAR